MRAHGARVLSRVLVHAQSNDLGVPDEPIRALFETIYERKSLAQ